MNPASLSFLSVVYADAGPRVNAPSVFSCRYCMIEYPCLGSPRLRRMANAISGTLPSSNGGLFPTLCHLQLYLGALYHHMMIARAVHQLRNLVSLSQGGLPERLGAPAPEWINSPSSPDACFGRWLPFATLIPPQILTALARASLNFLPTAPSRHRGC